MTLNQREAGGKRLREEHEEVHHDQSKERKAKFNGSSSFANVAKEVMASQLMKGFISKLEPMLRNMIREEVENGITKCARSIQRSPQMKIKQMVTPEFRLYFTRPLATPIFTHNKIEDQEGNPLQISIEYISNGAWSCPFKTAPQCVKVELVALKGEFSPDERGEWTQEQFEMSIEKERAGKRPLIVGDTTVVIKDATPATITTLMFTDNSSWVKSRTFRIGARVVGGSCESMRIKEAITEAFMVKDHRGDLCRKHFPPTLDDEVWRLVKIGKDGKHHERLSKENIKTVQDFLIRWSLDPNNLKEITGMSDKNWAAAISHANKCEKGHKLYIFKEVDSWIGLNSIFKVEIAMLDGQMYSRDRLVGNLKARVDRMVHEAYKQRQSLQVIDRSSWNDTTIQNGQMLQQGSIEEPNQDFVASSSYQINELEMGQQFDMGDVHYDNVNWY